MFNVQLAPRAFAALPGPRLPSPRLVHPEEHDHIFYFDVFEHFEVHPLARRSICEDKLR